MAWPFEEVVVVRHGRTEWNDAGRRQGRLDSPLTAAGRLDAERSAAALGGTDVDGVFSSPQGRALATASPIAAVIGRPVTVVDALAEVDHGEMAGLTNTEIEERFPGQLAARTADKYTWRFPRGESYADADVRAGAALDEVARSGVLRPVLVTHEMIGRMLLRQLVGLTVDEALARSLPHGEAVRVARPYRSRR